MHKCERCDRAISNWNEKATLLFGGVYADLCTSCRTDWGEAMKREPRYQDYMLWEAQSNYFQGRAIAQDPPSIAEWLELRKFRWDLERYFFNFGKQWLAEKVAVAGETV